MDKEAHAERTENVRLKLKALANLMINFSGDHMTAGEVQALGFMVHDISRDVEVLRDPK